MSETKKFSRGEKLTATTTGLFLALGLTACGGEEQSNAEPNPIPSDTITIVNEQSGETTLPTPEASPSESEAEGLQIEALDGQLPAQELAQATEDLIMDWWMSGADIDSIEATYNNFFTYPEINGNNEKLPVYTEKIAEQNAKSYQEVLFAEDWQSNPQLANFNTNQIDNNESYIEANLHLTMKGAPKDALWVATTEVLPDSAQETEGIDGQRVLTYDLQTRRGTRGGEQFEESSIFTERVTYQIDPSTGVTKIVGYDQIGKRASE